MKQLIILLILGLIGNVTFAQSKNLVPNPSLESSIKGYGPDATKFENMQPWTRKGPCIIDFYDDGSNYSNMNIAPEWLEMFEYSKRIKTKSKIELGHSAIIVKFESRHLTDKEKPYRRGYLQVKLLQPLVKGKKYKAGFLTAFHPAFASMQVNGMAMLFSDSLQLPRDTNNIAIGQPQVIHRNIITKSDTMALVSGEFIADANYQYLTIGNFTPAEQQQNIPYTCPQASDPTLKYLFLKVEEVGYIVDNVFVYEIE